MIVTEKVEQDGLVRKKTGSGWIVSYYPEHPFSGCLTAPGWEHFYLVFKARNKCFVHRWIEEENRWEPDPCFRIGFFRETHYRVHEKGPNGWRLMHPDEIKGDEERKALFESAAGWKAGLVELIEGGRVTNDR